MSERDFLLVAFVVYQPLTYMRNGLVIAQPAIAVEVNILLFQNDGLS